MAKTLTKIQPTSSVASLLEPSLGMQLLAKPQPRRADPTHPGAEPAHQ